MFVLKTHLLGRNHNEAPFGNEVIKALEVESLLQAMPLGEVELVLKCRLSRLQSLYS